MSGLVLYVRMADTTTYSVEVEAMASVKDLVDEVARQEWAPARAYILLVFGERELDDEEALLADIGVCPQSTLELRTGAVKGITAKELSDLLNRLCDLVRGRQLRGSVPNFEKGQDLDGYWKPEKFEFPFWDIKFIVEDPMFIGNSRIKKAWADFADAIGD
eukprot:Hpha_TRINITY_DN13234_c0_g1::TRINITY_DN13234_c0_g1_i1::g.155102::m.155102